jgi:hypothetical protein
MRVFGYNIIGFGLCILLALGNVPFLPSAISIFSFVFCMLLAFVNLFMEYLID